ncbi:MAG: hypothetical protein ABIQ73_08075 [Acidimicrobiales bacterium]
MTDEPARHLDGMFDVGGGAAHLGGERIETGARHHGDAAAEPFDARPQHRFGGRRVDARQRGTSLIDIRVAEEAQRDVPLLAGRVAHV